MPNTGPYCIVIMVVVFLFIVVLVFDGSVFGG